MAIRVAIYLTLEDDIASQRAACLAYAVGRGYEVAYIAQEEPGETTAWRDVQRLIRNGEASRVIMDSRRRIPADGVESISLEIRVPHSDDEPRRPRRI